MIQMLKQEILLRAASPLAAFNDERPFNSITINQLLLNLHQALVQCQELGDQKIKLTGQVVEMLNNKTRQLGLDPRSNGKSNQLLSFEIFCYFNWNFQKTLLFDFVNRLKKIFSCKSPFKFKLSRNLLNLILFIFNNFK